VAEDNLVNQKLLVQMLKRLGYVADLANDGLEAVAAWNKRHYDVIVRISIAFFTIVGINLESIS
jgi:CheY-like chemotaxis protein